MFSRESSPPPLRCIPWFWQFFGLDLVLVLSAAVLLILIDVSIIRCNRLGDTISHQDYVYEHRRYATEHQHKHEGSLPEPISILRKKQNSV